MTPQELMDLPGAGQAERWLRANGKWDRTPLELLYSIPEDKCTNAVNYVIDEAIAKLEAK